MTAGSLLPSIANPAMGGRLQLCLGSSDFALRKGLLRGKSLWDKCQNPRLSSQSSGHLVGGADNLLCCSILLAALFHGDAL